MKYVHERPEWPRFHWDDTALVPLLAEVRYRQGRFLGRLEGLGFSLQQDALLGTLTTDVLKTSEIEGERLDAEEVRSSIARRLGIEIGTLNPADRNVEGVVEMMLDATGEYRTPLTRERLWRWYSWLFPDQTGQWRDDALGPMQVVSGPIGRQRVHYEAPAAARLPQEMAAFLDWLRADEAIDGVLRSALAHLWFATIHPFDDGNGRIARAIADRELARSEGSRQRFYSMSAQIRLERKAYYDIFERTQRGTLDITAWMAWFLACLSRAIAQAQTELSAVLAKAQFWQSVADVPLNARQRTMLNRLLDGFEGHLTNAKWAALGKCSPDTALRDLQYLVERGVLAKGPEGGRSTSYRRIGNS